MAEATVRSGPQLRQRFFLTRPYKRRSRGSAVAGKVPRPLSVVIIETEEDGALTCPDIAEIRLSVDRSA
jgi:hypothetical protein